MNYFKIYESLIFKGQNRILDGYCETHHILPKCLGGTDDKFNLVRLTPEEHYLAHQLLIKMYPNNPKLEYAALFMTAARPSNKLYGWLRRRVAASMSQSQTGKGNSQYGKIWITNGSKNVKHPKELALPPGWKPGSTYPPTFAKLKLCQACSKQEQIIKTTQLAQKWFDRLNQSNANSIGNFLKESDYPYSKVAFIKMLKTYIPEFQPKAGKAYSYH